MREVIINSLCIALPIAAAPLLVLALKPLFAAFLREGADLFTELQVRHDLSLGIAHYVAIANVLLLVTVWIIAFACRMNGATLMQCTLIMLAGLVLAMIATVMIVRRRVGLVGRPALLVGLLVFTGGNLPMFVLVPAVLALV